MSATIATLLSALSSVQTSGLASVAAPPVGLLPQAATMHEMINQPRILPRQPVRRAAWQQA